MRFSLEPSYILHTRAFRETSVILEAFSRDQGRVALVARGARGKRSRWRNMLQPFRPLLLSWTQRGDMGTLTGADQVASPPPLSGEALFCGLYVNELMLNFNQRGDAHAALFEQYRHLLTGLFTGEAMQPLLRRFEADLLESAGVGLVLDHEHGSNMPIDPAARYDYVPGQGAIRSLAGKGGEGRLVSGEALLALKSGQIEPRHLPELKGLMRRQIRFSLGGREIKAQSLFQDV